MKQTDPNQIPADLLPVAELLADNRPQPTNMQLDSVESRVKARMRREAAPRRGFGFMRPRLLLTAMLATGLIMSGAGGALAVSGLSGSGNASVAQYRVVETPPSGGVKDEQSESTTPEGKEDTVETADQVATGGDNELPFTGYAAIPILAAGLALLAGGLVLRRRKTASAER